MQKILKNCETKSGEVDTLLMFYQYATNVVSFHECLAI